MSEQKQRSKDIIRTANIAESAHPRLKICGLSRPCDIEWVNDAGVDFAGFVFARSRRQVSPEQAKQLHSMLKKEIPAVGVFVNETIETIVGLVEDGVIDWVQLHGQEDEAYINELKSKVSCPVIQAFPSGRRKMCCVPGKATQITFCWIRAAAEPEESLTGL